VVRRVLAAVDDPCNGLDAKIAVVVGDVSTHGRTDRGGVDAVIGFEVRATRRVELTE
jgi:hypothetical protein